MEKRIKIILEPSEKNPFAVVYKPKGLASAPLVPDEDSAFTQTALIFPQAKNVQGKKPIEGGLLHRLDTATDGLLLIATRQDCYDALSQSQREGLFVKTYRAICQSIKSNSTFPPSPQNLTPPFCTDISSAFRFYGKGSRLVRPVTEESGSYGKKKSSGQSYTTRIELNNHQAEYEAICTIVRGFKHQVRCHLAWLGFPVKGDSLYNPQYREGEELLFSAVALEFPHPLTGEKFTVSLK